MSAPLFVLNPSAGGGRGHRVWSELLASHPELARAPAVAEPDPRKASEVLSERLREAPERVIAVGGDGTAHLTVNCLLAGGHGETIPFGLVPAGTGSDLARTLGIPRDPSAALDRALRGTPRPVDAIEVTSDSGERRFVVNVLSLGVSGLAVELLNRSGKRGPLAYLFGTLTALRRYRPAACRVALDGEPWFEGEILLLAVGNGTSFGKGMRIAPRARIDDGELDVVVVRPAPLPLLLLRLPRIYFGTHLGSSLTVWKRAREVRFEATGELPPFDLDGEDLAPGPFNARVLPGALRVAS